jgi:hypothetical protein
MTKPQRLDIIEGAGAYEPFRLTGDPGIPEELDDYMRGALA